MRSAWCAFWPCSTRSIWTRFAAPASSRARDSNALAEAYSGLIENVRGAGVMLAFDVPRADLQDALRDRAFRRGLVLLPAGERTLRFYPRYDTEPYAIAEGARDSESGRRGHRRGAGRAAAVSAGQSTPSRSSIRSKRSKCVEITAANFHEHRNPDHGRRDRALRLVEAACRPTRRATAGGRLLQLPCEMLEATLSNARAIGVALRDA